MDTTDGLYRGQAVVDLGTTITVPVGKGTLGRVINVLGDPIDKLGPITATEYRSIHAKPPTFIEQVSISSLIYSFTHSFTLSLSLIFHFLSHSYSSHSRFFK
jgi:F0F1-type ATP synthase beta subunit